MFNFYTTMLINNTFYPNYSYRTSFGSNTGGYRTEDGNRIETFTNMFRSDLDWENFTDYFVEHFKDKDKVNVIQFAASDGSEAYTQIMTLLENHEDTDKFFPIKAYDINPEICDNAKSGLINISNSDVVKIISRDINFDKYFKDTDKSLYIKDDSLKNETRNHADTYKAKDILTDKVKFQRADMFDVMYDHKDDSNSIILCRNVIDYLSDREADHFTTLAASRLKKGSLFAIGEIDSPHVDELLESKGFKKVMPYVFEKE